MIIVTTKIIIIVLIATEKCDLWLPFSGLLFDNELSNNLHLASV